MTMPSQQRRRRLALSATSVAATFVAATLVALSAGCSALRPAPMSDTAFYELDVARTAPPLPATGPTLVINPTHAAAGFDSKRIIYTRQSHQLEYFAHSEWVDTPARMLAPLLVAAAEGSGAFLAAMLTPSTAAGDLRLDTEIVRLQHEFDGGRSQVRFTLRAYLVDGGTRKIIASREFESVVPATSNDPYGGVIAANAAVRGVLAEFAGFCAQAVRKLPSPSERRPKTAIPRP